MKTLYFYTTSGCHLCDLAEDVLWPLLENREYRLQVVDIASNPELQLRYGTRIPVIRREDTGAELGWPFSPGQAKRYLAGE